MRNLVKYVGIGLLVMGLAACDDKDTNATAQGSVAESNATGNPVNLLDGKLSFSLPADMTDQSGKLGTQANNMHVWSDATGQKAVIVIRFVIRVVIRWMNEPLWPFIERKKSMRNLVKYVGIGLLVMGLAACDDKDTNATAQGSVAESNATGNPVNLLDGKLSFSLPADMTDQSGKLGTQANNMHVWSDATGQKAVIVIMGDDPKEDLAVLAKRLEDQQRSRDPQLQVVTNKAIELKGHKMQQLDSIISAKGQTAYSSVILGNVGNQLLTMQITLPADDQQKAQTTAENIINTLVIQ